MAANARTRISGMALARIAYIALWRCVMQTSAGIARDIAASDKTRFAQTIAARAYQAAIVARPAP
jgi:hypothetical protein